MKKIFFYLLLVFIPLFGGIIFIKERPTVTQAYMARVGSAKIDVYGICRNVMNSGSKELMVPYKTKEEWCSFLKASLKDVTITNCQVCYWNFCSNGVGHWECKDYNVGSCP